MKTAKHQILIIVALLVAVAFPAFVHAQTLLTGKTTSVVDGDTIKVLTQARQEKEIRLEGIDAPEKRQAFGSESTTHLSNLVFEKTVNLVCTALDEYQRLVCKVLLPSGEDVDLDQIKAGSAWHYKQFQSQQKATDRTEYVSTKNAARRAPIGPWAHSLPFH